MLTFSACHCQLGWAYTIEHQLNCDTLIKVEMVSDIVNHIFSFFRPQELLFTSLVSKSFQVIVENCFQKRKANELSNLVNELVDYSAIAQLQKLLNLQNKRLQMGDEVVKILTEKFKQNPSLNLWLKTYLLYDSLDPKDLLEEINHSHFCLDNLQSFCWTNKLDESNRCNLKVHLMCILAALDKQSNSDKILFIKVRLLTLLKRLESKPASNEFLQQEYLGPLLQSLIEDDYLAWVAELFRANLDLVYLGDRERQTLLANMKARLPLIFEIRSFDHIFNRHLSSDKNSLLCLKARSIFEHLVSAVDGQRFVLQEEMQAVNTWLKFLGKNACWPVNSLEFFHSLYKQALERKDRLVCLPVAKWLFCCLALIPLDNQLKLSHYVDALRSLFDSQVPFGIWKDLLREISCSMQERVLFSLFQSFIQESINFDLPWRSEIKKAHAKLSIIARFEEIKGIYSDLSPSYRLKAFEEISKRILQLDTQLAQEPLYQSLIAKQLYQFLCLLSSDERELVLKKYRDQYINYLLSKMDSSNKPMPTIEEIAQITAYYESNLF